MNYFVIILIVIGLGIAYKLFQEESEIRGGCLGSVLLLAFWWIAISRINANCQACALSSPFCCEWQVLEWGLWTCGFVMGLVIVWGVVLGGNYLSKKDFINQFPKKQKQD